MLFLMVNHNLFRGSSLISNLLRMCYGLIQCSDIIVHSNLMEWTSCSPSMGRLEVMLNFTGIVVSGGVASMFWYDRSSCAPCWTNSTTNIEGQMKDILYTEVHLLTPNLLMLQNFANCNLHIASPNIYSNLSSLEYSHIGYTVIIPTRDTKHLSWQRITSMYNNVSFEERYASNGNPFPYTWGNGATFAGSAIWK